MSLNLSPLSKIKTGVHAVQAAMIFIAACIALAMDTKQGHSDGRGRWFNILCYFSIPALVYLAMVPVWERSQRFANLYAFIAVDAVFTIFWLSAWASLVSWAREGMASGATLKNIPVSQSNCTTFDPSFGVPEKCSLANDCVGFGVVIFLLFIATTVLSVMYLMKARKSPENDRPWLGKEYGLTPSDPEAGGNKDPVWSTDTHDIGADDDHNRRAPSDGTDRGGDQEEDEYHLLHGAADAEPDHRPGRRWDQRADAEYQRDDTSYAPPPPEYDTEYRGAHGYHAPHHDGYEDPSESEPQQPVSFPSAPYGYRG